MRKNLSVYIFYLFLSLLSCFFILTAVFAQEDTNNANNQPNLQATCDLCGFCLNQNPEDIPSDWKSCAQCLYPDLYGGNVPDQPDGKTLITDPNTKEPPARKKGAVYTFLGCINTNLDSFQEAGAAVDVVSSILNVIFKLVGAAAFVYLVYGGFVILTSSGNPEKISYGKRIIIRSLIGIFIALSAVFIVGLIGQAFDLPMF
ncbi:MAG: hypothetical protein KatS3mg090_0560 [Patescibacteria group bacterium]|nr:MAG: hypothetical protein KatS3mg090_0560 [Patescibacteria group bacterium]